MLERMRTVAVLVYDLMIEYNITVVEGIIKYFRTKEDVRVVIVPLKAPFYKPNDYDYQFWTNIDYLQTNDSVEAILVVANSFINEFSYEQLGQALSRLSDKPIVSVAGDLKIPGSKYTCISCKKSYEQVVEHLYKKHNITKIGFFNGALTKSPESAERENAYKAALKKFGLEFHKEWVLKGDFTPGTADQIVRKTYKSKEEVPYQALLCANDYTACGAYWGFFSLGMRIPEDIILFGFDNTDIALAASPTLSTISQDIFQSGYAAAEVAYRMLEGKKVPVKTLVPAEPIYRQSCGCIPTKANDTAYIDAAGNFHEADDRNKDKFLSIVQSAQNLLTIYSLLGLINTNLYLKEFLDNLSDSMTSSGIDFLAICFYDTPIIHNAEDSFEVPSLARLYSLVDNPRGIKQNFYNIEGISFDPHKKILPENFGSVESATYIVHPIYSCNQLYGYLVAKFSGTNFNLHSIFLRILNSALVRSYELSKEKIQNIQLVERNQNLNLQSKTDELTKLLNRRGFMEYGQRLMDLSAAIEKEGCVFFFDLDGLKKINDNYGHDIGDLAIKTEAQVLKDAFRDSDLVGRLSGDEFAAVAPGFAIDKIEVLRERLRTLNKICSEQVGLPFTLSISVGATVFNHQKNDLITLLQEADDNLYEEKHLKHSNNAK